MQRLYEWGGNNTFMTLRHLLITALRALRANKSRSALTILGIVIGITAIIVVMAMGQGAENLILDQVRGFGSETITIEPGREPKGPSDFLDFFTDSLKPSDLIALQKPSNVQGLKDITPLIAQIVTVSYGKETKRTNFRGTSPAVLEILNARVQKGTFFTEEDIKQRSTVAVIGVDIKKELFGNADPVGLKIKIKNRTFRVIGLLAKKGPGLVPVDDMVFTPHTTAREYLFGLDHYQIILARAKSEKEVPRVENDIKLTLRETHGITDPEKDDFHVSTQEDAIQRIGTISTALTVLLTAIAAISLIVGGVGIMNIMLVSVVERTREIGLRKALGATNRDILTQFLLEAILLTGLGGVIGILMGTLFSFSAVSILHNFISTGWNFVFPLRGAILGVLVSGTIGLVFGLYPARQAAQKSPIEALRYE